MNKMTISSCLVQVYCNVLSVNAYDCEFIYYILVAQFELELNMVALYLPCRVVFAHELSLGDLRCLA